LCGGGDVEGEDVALYRGDGVGELEIEGVPGDAGYGGMNWEGCGARKSGVLEDGEGDAVVRGCRANFVQDRVHEYLSALLARA